ncbi:MAG: glycosyltransferase [Acidobacteriota bacterium]
MAVTGGGPLCIVHVDDGLGWRGGQQQVAFLVEEQLRAGHRPIVLCPAGAPLLARVRELGAGCASFELTAGWWSRLGRARRALRDTVEKERADVVHAHTSHAHLLVRLLRGRQPPLRVVSRRLQKISGSVAARWKYGRGVDLYIAVSTAVRRALVKSGVAPSRIAVAPSAIDAARFAMVAPREEVLAEFSLPARVRLIGSLGSLVPQKAHLDLIDGFALLARRQDDLHLLILGEGPLRPVLGDRARALGIASRVHLPGYRSDLGRLLPHLSVMAFPSLFEGMPNAVLEALAAGVPVVATPAGGTGEVIHDGRGGFLVPFHAPRRLARAIEELLDDPARARRLAAAGRQHVLAHHVPPVMASKTEEAYRRGLAHRSQDGSGRWVGIRRGATEVAARDRAIGQALLAAAGQVVSATRSPPAQAGDRGRARIHRLRLADRPVVVKQHRRGGLPGRVLSALPGGGSDRWIGSRRVRRECFLAGAARARGAPIPASVAWLAVHAGPFCRLWAASEEITEGVPVSVALAGDNGRSRQRILAAAARAVARLHDAGVVHGDLNVGNLLWAGANQPVWVIDLSAARLHPRAGTAARGRDLARLERSALKVLGPAGLSRSERFRFVAAYERARDWLEPRDDRRSGRRRLLAAVGRRRAWFFLHRLTR